MDNGARITVTFQLGSVIPAKAGIQTALEILMDPRFRGDDTAWWQNIHFCFKEILLEQLRNWRSNAKDLERRSV